jgi:hypothetical protein
MPAQSRPGSCPVGGAAQCCYTVGIEVSSCVSLFVLSMHNGQAAGGVAAAVEMFTGLVRGHVHGRDEASRGGRRLGQGLAHAWWVYTVLGLRTVGVFYLTECAQQASCG